MPDTHVNRLQCTVSGTPGTGTITVSTAVSGFRTFASGDGGKTFSCLFVDGTAWEVATGCTYTHSGTTLTRGTLENSSTGSAISLTSAAIVSVIAPASFGNTVEGYAPNGSNGQVQVKNNANFAGDSGLAYNSTTKALTVGGATVTTSNPVLNLSQTWNASGVTFNGLRLNVTNTASATASTLVSLEEGSNNILSIRPGAATNTTAFSLGNSTRRNVDFSGAGSSSNFAFYPSGVFNAGYCLIIGGASTGAFTLFRHGFLTTAEFSSSGNFTLQKDGSIGWANEGGGGGVPLTAIDTTLFRDAANTLAQRNGTNAQIFRVYNTFTNSTNYERAEIGWSSNVLRIGTENAGTGTARAVEIETANTTRLTVGSAGGLTVADANDVAVGTTTGTKIGTATSQKLGFWNATPIVQPTTAVAAAAFTANSGTAVNDASTFDGYTIAQIVKALRNAGLLA